MTAGDDVPIFRPRIGRSRKPTSRSGAASFRNAVLRSSSRSLRRRAANWRLARVSPWSGRANARRVAVKAHLLRTNVSAAKSTALHVRYIERDGVEILRLLAEVDRTRQRRGPGRGRTATYGPWYPLVIADSGLVWHRPPLAGGRT